MTTITDWRINLETGKSVYFPGVVEVETSEHPVAAGLRDFLLDEIARTFENPLDQFSARIQQVFYRFQRLTPTLYSLRVVPSQIPEIQALGHRSAISRALLDENYNRGGLILISGAAGSGKSTTAASVVRERLRRYGGYCLTIEDPIEYHLEGFHGAGFCNQIEAADTKDYLAQVMRAKRAFPARILGMLYMGEIRDQFTADAAAQMAVAGFLVISTIHSFNLISAIQNYLELMDVENSNIARYTAASCLKLIVCQRWLRGERLVSDMLPINDAAMAAIKNGALHTLKDAIANVEAKMRSQVT
jgi:Tfp pilus assembly pilus retraction ATPase PilT